MRWSLCWLPPSGDPKCFGTSKVSILAIASITFPSNQKELSVNYENNSPPDVARRRIAVLGYKSKSEVEGGINWIKGFLPLLWKAAGTFLSALSHPNTRNNSFGSTTGDWRLQKHPVNEIKSWIYCVFLQKKYAVAQNIKFNSKRKRMTFCTKLRLQIWTFRNLASDSHRAQTSKIFDSTLRLLSHSPSLTFVWQLLTKIFSRTLTDATFAKQHSAKKNLPNVNPFSNFYQLCCNLALEEDSPKKTLCHSPPVPGVSDLSHLFSIRLFVFLSFCIFAYLYCLFVFLSLSPRPRCLRSQPPF